MDVPENIILRGAPPTRSVSADIDAGVKDAFLAYVVKPWIDLNQFLSKPFALQPDLSDPLRLGANLSIEIRHLAEKTHVQDADARKACFAQDVLRDVADAWKHGKLDSQSRDNYLSLTSEVEFKGDLFRFIRNSVSVEHATKGSHDLLFLTRDAILFWAPLLGISVTLPEIAEAPNDFNPLVALYFDDRYQVNMKAVRMRFYERDQQGVLQRKDPPACQIEILKAEL